ncbi:hypothetical protein [Methanobrevibacter sp.]
MSNPFNDEIDLARMISIELALNDISGEIRSNYISYLKKEQPEAWNAYVSPKKAIDVIIEE